MRQAAPELTNLPHCDVPLEGVLLAERCPEEVGIHDHVRQRVGPGAIPGSAKSIIVSEEEAPDHANSCMVIHMQEGKLGPVLLQEDPQSVEPIQKLGEKMHEHKPLAT